MQVMSICNREPGRRYADLVFTQLG